jgi:hypothetical protein
MMVGLKGKGLGQSSLVDAIAQAIYQMEGNGPNTIATRNNNPGNLRSGPGQIGTNGGYAVFPDMATGFAALDNQIQLNIDRGLTLQEFFGGKPGVYAGYAPAADSNQPTTYANFVAGQVGIDANTPLNQIQSGMVDVSGGGIDPNTGLPLDTSNAGDAAGLFGLDSNTTVMVIGGVVLVGALLLFSGGRG